jgi:methyl-accepting chemotaxis protein
VDVYGLLAPAIMLMNKLSYAKKFGVISLTFFIPLLLLSYAIINQTYQSIQKTVIEQKSLTAIDDLLSIVDQASNYRDIGSVQVILNNKEQLNSTAEQLESSLYKNINSFTTKHRGTDVAAEVASKLPAWKKSFARVSENRQTIIADQFKTYHKVINEILFVANNAAQSSGISLDTNQNVQLLLNLVITDYPAYVESLGFAHSVGVFSIAQVYLNATVYDTLNDVYDAMDGTIRALNQSHSSLVKENPMFAKLFSKVFPSVEKDFSDVLSKLDEEVISANSINIKWTDFSDFYHTKLKNILTVREIAFTQLDAILESRKNELTQKLITVAVAIALVMLLIVYLYAAFFWSVRSTVGEFHDAAHKISAGDMRVRVSVASKDEMGELTSEFNVMVENIHSLMQAVQGTSTEVASAMEKVGKNASQSENAANEQLAQTEQVASAITEMAATAEEVNRQSGEAANSASQATEQAGQANQVVSETLSQITALAEEIMRSTEVINTLSENSENIASMLAVIKGIAEQTNLLALNAAIEAARAGEQGRGFAVVADEVRTLASRTQTSAQEIDEVMTSIHNGISSAVEVMGNSHMMAQDTVESSSQVRVALEQIVQMVGTISQINGQISTSASEQTQVARTIDENVVKINDLGRDTVNDAQHTVTAIKEVIQLTESLQEKMDRFQV